MLSQRSRSASPLRSNDDRQVDSFFSAIIDEKRIVKKLPTEKPIFILVCHMAPTLFPFLRAINKIGIIGAIIPKGFQRESAKKIIDELNRKKEEFNYGYFFDPGDPDDAEIFKRQVNEGGIELIAKLTRGNKFIIIDIGGYFSQTFEKIVSYNSKDAETIRSNFIGIVEDTENGHQKYFNVLERLKSQPLIVTQKNALAKIYSVARCDLKKTEDYNVGKSIVEASGTIIRMDSHAILERMTIAGVLGFGKIGRSIAEHLRQKNLREVIVYDTDILRQMEASSLGFKVVSRPFLINNSQIIFCATGSKCFKAEELIYTQDNVFIASCTSAEDEFDFSFRSLIRKEENQKKFGNILKLKLGNKSINLLDDGNAVNFVHGAVNGPYIYSVQAGLIVSAINLITAEPSKVLDEAAKLKELTKEEMQPIATKWLESFDKCDSHVDLHNDTYLINERCKYDLTSSYGFVLRYLTENEYFTKCEELKFIMEKIQSVLSHKADPIEIIAEIIPVIKAFLSKAQFSCIMGYVSEILLRFLKPIESHSRIHELEVSLLFLRAHADLFININSKENWESSIKEALKNSFTELYNKLIVILSKQDEEAQKAAIEFGSDFLDIINFFKQNRMEFKIGKEIIEEIVSIINTIKITDIKTQKEEVQTENTSQPNSKNEPGKDEAKVASDEPQNLKPVNETGSETSNKKQKIGFLG